VQIFPRSLSCAVGLIKRAARAVAVAGALVAVAAPAAAQAPDDDWRTITTEHFRVTFPERLEPLGRRAADRAEWAWSALRDAFIEPPDGVIDVLVTDHTDVSNGFAQVQPSNRITVYARPPVDQWSLGYFDDWMELVVTHELAHVVHLDHVRNPLGRLARGIFGRVQSEWPFFPGLTMPGWVTEGLATWYESRLTSSGRVHGTFQEMQIRAAVLEGRFEGIDQASGGSALWPAGNRPYLYGARFFEYLLEKHGDERMAEFVEAVAGQWIPYRLNAAGREAFGASLSEEWSAWEAHLGDDLGDLDERLRRLGPISEPERLTTDARWGFHPAVSPDGSRLVYVRSDGRSDLQLRLDDPAGGSARQLTRTNGLATWSWLPDGRVLFSQLELQGPYRAYADLYVVDVGGRVERLTDGARLTEPSPAPDGRSAVAVRHGDGTTGLVRVDLASGQVVELVAPDPDVHWAFPALSPDGRWIAATRWESDASSDVVVLDAGTGREVRRVTRDRALDLAPAWSGDGRWLVWSSDRTGIPNILGVPIDPTAGVGGAPKLLTNVRTGATFPSVDPSGRWLYFTGYHVDGWDVERIPFAGSDAPEAPEPDARFAAAPTEGARGAVDAPVEPYQAGPTLRPRYWELSLRAPIAFPAVSGDNLFLRRREGLGWAVGAQTSGRDLVGRHAFSVVGRVFTGLPRVEAGFAYSNATLGNPVLTLAASQSWDDGGQLLGGATPDTLFVLERERALTGAVTLVAPRWRHNLSLTLSGAMIQEHAQLLDVGLEPTSAYTLSRPNSTLGEVGGSINFVNARSHSFQLGADRGVNLFVQGRLRSETSLPDSLDGVYGVDRSFGDVAGRARAAIPLWATGRVTHVLALQASGGVADGPGATSGHFDVGGAAGRPETLTGAELFGGGFIFFPVRGYPTSARFGRLAWAASAEYRVPIALINRGLGAWPVHLDRVFGSLFVDAGNAWGPDVTPSGFTNALRDPLVSVGAELTTEFLGLFDTLVPLRLGVGVPLVSATGAEVYLRVGVAF
jgi:Tol biopolymer transport system component